MSVCIVVSAVLLGACGQADNAGEDTIGGDPQAAAPSADAAQASAPDGCSDVLADGSSREVTQDDYVIVSREGNEAELICPDIEVDGGVVHIIDAFLFQPAADPAADEDSTESEENELGTEPVQPGDPGVRPDLREELDERTPSKESAPADQSENQ